MKYRKRPVVVDAMQWRGPEDDAALAFFMGTWEWCHNSEGLPCIKTLESGDQYHVGSKGDYVIKGVKRGILFLQAEYLRQDLRRRRPHKPCFVCIPAARHLRSGRGDDRTYRPVAQEPVSTNQPKPGGRSWVAS